MSRRCSHCGHNGHNSRTCPDRGVKLFGVRLTTEGLMRKSVSMGNLLHYTASASSANNNNNSNLPLTPEQSESGAADDGYVSDGMVQSSKSRERKKGVPWTEDEHKMFLLGLQKLGKGDWRGISRNFVTSRTPTQVASHAQKYFLRQSNLNKRKRRSSLFDIAADTATDYHQGIPQFSAVVREHNSRNFLESGASPNFAMCMGPFSLQSFSPSLINPHPLSLTTSKVENPIVDKIAGEKAAFSIPKMAERQDSREHLNSACHYSFPLPLGPELATNTRHVTRTNTATTPNLEAKESIENSGLNLSIAPPCADLSNNIGSNSNAIRVL